MKNLKLLAAAALAAGAVAAMVYYLVTLGPTVKGLNCDYQCTKCGNKFSVIVYDAASVKNLIKCPKCGELAAERVIHFQCRKCWRKFDMPASKATIANIICPYCDSRAVRDLDNPIPGDNEPVEGGKPYPGN